MPSEWSERYHQPTNANPFHCHIKMSERLVDALNVVAAQLVGNAQHGVLLGLEWLWQRMDAIVGAAAAWSLAYHVAATGFCYGWGEGTDLFEHLVQHGLSKAAGWLVWGYFAHSLLYPDPEDNFDGAVPNDVSSPLNSHIVAALTVLVAVVTWLLWDAQVHDSRISIVQGGANPHWLLEQVPKKEQQQTAAAAAASPTNGLAAALPGALSERKGQRALVWKR
jgi:hypothetical protein